MRIQHILQTLSMVSCAVLAAGCAQVNLQSENPNTDRSAQPQATTTVTVTKKPSEAKKAPEGTKPSDVTTVTGTQKPKRPRRKPGRPGVDTGAILPETNQNYATFPVTNYLLALNEAQAVSAPVPQWMGKGRIGHNQHLEFSVDGVQLLLGSRATRGTSKKDNLETRAGLWQQEDPAKITYKKMTTDGFVLSGSKNGHIFYEVYEIHAGTEYFGSWFYPATLKDEMDPVIAMFYKKFDANRPA